MPGNARRGRPQGKCHRKHTAGVPPVRVKRCGKSAPPGRQRAGHGKPHPEQDHVGTRAAPRRYVRARQARFRADVRVGCLTGPATAPLDEWPSPGNRYRTRLTGHLAVLISGNPVWAHQGMPNHAPNTRFDGGFWPPTPQNQNKNRTISGICQFFSLLRGVLQIHT